MPLRPSAWWPTPRRTLRDTDRQTFQAAECWCNNLNTMHSRAGAQTPFSSVELRHGHLPEGRMVIKNMLLATEEGLGCSGETPIFPVQIFRVKEGGTTTRRIRTTTCSSWLCTARPSACSRTSPLSWTRRSTRSTTRARRDRDRVYGRRTRHGQRNDPDREVTPGRGNLSFTSINLPRLAICAKGDIDLFFGLCLTPSCSW